jgi:hypothetical protein
MSDMGRCGLIGSPFPWKGKDYNLVEFSMFISAERFIYFTEIMGEINL